MPIPRHGWWTSYGTKGFSPKDQKNVLRNMVSSLIAKGHIETGLFKAKEVQVMVNKMVVHAKKNTNARDLKIRQFVRTNNPEVVPSLYNLATKYANVEGNYAHLHKIGFSLFDKSPRAYLEFINSEKSLEYELVLREAARRLLDANEAAASDSTAVQPTKKSNGKEARLQTRITQLCDLRGMSEAEFQEEVVKLSKDERFLKYLDETKVELETPLPHIRDNPLLSIRDRNPQHKYRIRDAMIKWRAEKLKEKDYECVPRKVLEDTDLNFEEEAKDWYRWSTKDIHKRVSEDGGGWGKREKEKGQYYKTKISEGTLTYEDLYALRQAKTPPQKNELPKPPKMYTCKARREGYF